MCNYFSISRVAALLLLLAVVVIFVSPAFDIPETALRAKALAQLITLVLAAAGAIITGVVSPRLCAVGHAQRNDCASAFSPSVELSLPLLC